MTIDELQVIADLTVRLTELRQNECKYLSVENFAPPLFRDLVAALSEGQRLALLGST